MNNLNTVNSDSQESPSPSVLTQNTDRLTEPKFTDRNTDSPIIDPRIPVMRDDLFRIPQLDLKSPLLRGDHSNIRFGE